MTWLRNSTTFHNFFIWRLKTRVLIDLHRTLRAFHGLLIGTSVSGDATPSLHRCLVDWRRRLWSLEPVHVMWENKAKEKVFLQNRRINRHQSSLIYQMHGISHTFVSLLPCAPPGTTVMTETEYLAHVCAYLSAPGPADNHARKKKGKIINKLSELLVLRKHEKGRAKAYVCCRCCAADAAPVATQHPTSVERKKEGENQIVSCCSIPPLLSSLLSSSSS